MSWRGLAAVLIALTAASAGYAVLVDPHMGESIAGIWARRVSPEGIDPRAAVDPNRRYHLVVWDYRLPLTSPSGEAFEESARSAIRRFQSRYPNVTVDLLLLDPADGSSQLSRALAAGYPPDVYCSFFGLPALGTPLQVPIGLYLDYNTWSGYHPVAWQTVKVGGTVWAWPRWMMFWPWLANDDFQPRASAAAGALSEAGGWTRDEFLALVESVSRAPARWDRATTLDTPSPVLVVRDLVFSAYLGVVDPPDAAAFWTGSEVQAVVEWLANVREAGGFRTGDPSQNPGIVDSFVHGRTAVLAGITPWAVSFLLEVNEREAPGQYTVPSRAGRPPMSVVSPPRGDGAPPAVWVSAAPVMVFRQARYRGDDHTRLAVELARELSLGTRPWTRDQVLCVPAGLSEMASWELRLAEHGPAGAFVRSALRRLADLPADRLSQALTAINYGPSVPVPGLSSASRGGPSAPGSIGRAAAFAETGYLGPFLRSAILEISADLWSKKAVWDDLLPLIRAKMEAEP